MMNHTDGEGSDNVVVLPTSTETAASSEGDKPTKKTAKKSGAKKAKEKSASKKTPAKKKKAAAKKPAAKKPAAKKAAAKDGTVKKNKTAAKKAEPKTKRTKGQAGTKAQTQVPLEVMKMIKAKARDEKIKPADVVRVAIFKGLGYKPAA